VLFFQYYSLLSHSAVIFHYPNSLILRIFSFLSSTLLFLLTTLSPTVFYLFFAPTAQLRGRDPKGQEHALKTLNKEKSHLIVKIVKIKQRLSNYPFRECASGGATATFFRLISHLANS
jgi:hypothetical protein